MGNFIRTVGLGGPATSPDVKRASGVLSDGSAVMMVVDSNQSGVTGDGGDNTNIPKIYVYHSADRENWTLKATVTAPDSQTNEFVASMVVDSANGIHIAFGVGVANGACRYVKLTYASGPTWTVGTQVNLAPPTGTWSQPVRIDIDTMGGSANSVVVGAYYIASGSSGPVMFMSWVRTSTGTWVAQNKIDLITGSGNFPYTDDISVSGDTTPIGGDNVAIYTFVATRKSSNGTDFGDIIYVVRVNASTGARISLHRVKEGFNRGLNNGFRIYHLFASGEGEWILAGTVGNAPWKICAMKFRWIRSTGVYQEVAPLALSPNLPNMYRNAASANWGAHAYAGNGRVLYFAISTGGNLVSSIATITGNQIKFPATKQAFDDNYAYNGVGVDLVFSGASTNFSPSRIDVLAFYYKTNTTNAFRMESVSKLDPMAPANVKPASTTVSTDQPQLSSEHKLRSRFAQLRVKAEWQIAGDAGFTTNIRGVEQPDTSFVIADYTPSPTNAIVRATENVPGDVELFQGTWYIRARTVDEAGSRGPWSAAKSFTVAHPPSVSNLYPTGGAVFVWGDSGNVTFTWDFSDPSVTDTQTAYQIVVEDASTQTVLVDSDKVTSTLDIATLELPPPAKDVNLRWRMRVWDSDDVAGAYSPHQLFFVADPPAPEITDPITDEVLSTAVPVITWSEGLGGTRQQESYRIRVTQGSAVVYNSNWIVSSATTHQIPVGYLKNGQHYTITLDVRDNLALEGAAFVAVSTSWTPPDGPQEKPLAYTYEYDRRGFVYITWSNEGRDPDFVGWVVYRRQRGSSDWMMLGQYTSGSDRFAHRDYLAGTDQVYEYTVTQVVQRFGDILESVISDVITVCPLSDKYWLIDPTNMTAALPLHGVNSDKYVEEYEMEKYHVIGRGSRVEYGDRLGYAGGLSLNLRDRQIAAQPTKNYARNPTLSVPSEDLQSPAGWTVASAGAVGTVIGDYVDTINPAPTGITPFRLRADAMGTSSSDAISLTQKIDGIDFPSEFKQSGKKVTISAWVANSENNTSKSYRITAKWLNAGGSLIASVNTGAIKPEIHSVGSYILPSDPDGQVGNPVGRWRRIQLICFVPTTVPSGIEVTFQLEGDTTGSGTTAAELVITGIQIEPGGLTGYIDGDTLGGSWIGDPGLSGSETTGFYTARQQRQALMRYKALKSGLFMRNPFGDVWYVAPGDISVDRVAGVGKAEFVNVEVPYQEMDS